MLDLQRVARNFRLRRLEWTLAVYATYFGLWLLLPTPAFTGGIFAHSLTFAREGTWGALYLVAGITHLTALHVNGKAWWTPFARFAAVFLNANVFLATALTIAKTAPWSSGFATYLFLAFGFCGAALWAAASECGDEIKIWNKARKDGTI